MGRQYVSIETKDLRRFIDKLNMAGKGQFRKDLLIFLEGIAGKQIRMAGEKRNFDSLGSVYFL